MIVSFFFVLKEATFSFLTDAVDIFRLLLKNVDFIVFKSEVTKSRHIWKGFFSSISRSQFWSINKYILLQSTQKMQHTHIIHKIWRGNGKLSSMY